MKKNDNWNPFLKDDFTMKDLIGVKCSGCSNNIFDRYFKMYKVPSDKTKVGKEKYINYPIYVCANCGEVLDTEISNDPN